MTMNGLKNSLYKRCHPTKLALQPKRKLAALVKDLSVSPLCPLSLDFSAHASKLTLILNQGV